MVGRPVAVAVATILLAATAGSASAAVLTVTTAADVVNGDTSTPARLRANPGPDGISLREAILAVHGAPGPHVISFAPMLAGRVIRPATGFTIHQRFVTIAGFYGVNGSPAITIDAQAAFPILFTVRASDVRLSRLRIVNVRFERFAVSVRTGLWFGEPGPNQITNLRVDGNVFENPPSMASTGLAISIGMEADTTGTRIADVTIAGNTFRGFRGVADADFGQEAVHIQPAGTNNVIERVVIYRNLFDDCSFGVELVAANAQNSQVRRVHIVGNTFRMNQQPVNLDHIGTDGRPSTSGNLIADVEIAGNVFHDNRGPDVVLLGGLTNATGNAVLRTRIVNNLMTGNTVYGGVSLVGGREGSSSNQVHDVSIVNNTIVDNVGGGLDVNANLSGGVGNTVTGVVVRNSLFWANTKDFFGVSPAQVDHSLTAQAGFAGMNGNVSGDPLFVNAAAGNFRLRSGSPAIDTGSSSGAPRRDLNCLSRVDDPGTPNSGAGAGRFYDIGAFEFRGGTRDCAAHVTVVAQGGGMVQSHPDLVACASTCLATIPAGRRLVLTARPAPGFVFAGWAGECSGRSDCALTVVTDVRVVARFISVASPLAE